MAVLRNVTPLLGFEPSVRFVGPIDTLIRGTVIHEIEAMVREAVTNAAKHAQPTQVIVQITADADSLSVDISDNGIGISLHPARRASGLRNLKRRAENLDGTLTITRTRTHRNPDPLDHPDSLTNPARNSVSIDDRTTRRDHRLHPDSLRSPASDAGVVGGVCRSPISTAAG